MWLKHWLVTFTVVLCLITAVVVGEEDVREEFALRHVFHHGSHWNPKFLARINLHDRDHQLPRFNNIARMHPKHLRRSLHLASTQTALPNPQDQLTVLHLAEMSFNAYENRNSSENWKIITGYNTTAEYGWNGDGLRGYVYANPDRSIIIMAIKGTSLTFLGYGGPTSDKDQIVDNLMFSCCCARVNARWDPVCDCYTGPENTCSQTCLASTMQNNSLSYVTHAQDIFDQLKLLYPRSTFWLTGHSLGGSIASILAIKNGVSAFGYEAPGELLYAQRLGLPIEPNDMARYPIYHFTNDKDPIADGTCTGATSSCSISGYALETGCHIGSLCVYPNSSPKSVNEHRISVVIDKLILLQPVPKCLPQNNCFDCKNWFFK